MKDSEQLTELEIRLAYLEDTLNALDAVITGQATQLDRLEKTCGSIIRKLQNLDETLATIDNQGGDEPPPPHY